MKTIIKTAALVLLILQLVGCATKSTVAFQSNQEDIALYLEGEPLGSTPLELKMSNGIWADPYILVKKEGFYDYRYHLEREIKPLNLISGFFFFWPWLWVYGPAEYQYIELFQQQ